ncbi:MAG: methyl-accepting chemotaxis protein, partial [Rhodospirillales bacterium]|nr:methyl-accepting chemotaxis protein [Rhodospirillales bacterium]
MTFHSIQTKIASLSALCMVGATVLLLGFSTWFSVQTSRFVTTQTGALLEADAKQILQGVAAREAGNVRSELERAFDAARTMARAFEAIAVAPSQGRVPLDYRRPLLNGILYKVLQQNPSFNGTYSAWEPNALDDQDRAYSGRTETGTDATGRFL